MTSGRVLVDGLGVGDVGNNVLRMKASVAGQSHCYSRTIEGDTGNVIAGPDIISRGFVYVRVGGSYDEIREVCKTALQKCEDKKE